VPVHQIGLEVPSVETTTGVTDSGIVIGTLSASTPDQTFSLSIGDGTQVLISNENSGNPVDLSQVGSMVPAKIEVTNPDINTIPPLPEGWIPVSKAYDIHAVTNGITTGVSMSQPAEMTIAYNIDELPTITDDLAVFAYDYKMQTWVQLPSSELKRGWLSTEINNFSVFIVLAKAGQQNVTPPANIIIQRIIVNPPRIIVGRSTDVRVLVTNKGGTEGDYAVVVRIAGKTQKTQTVHLAPGESREVDLIFTPTVSGIFTISAGSASDNLIVDPRSMPDVVETNYWWLLCIAMGISTFFFSLIRRKRKGHSEEID
jgi:hypothetical protein